MFAVFILMLSILGCLEALDCKNFKTDNVNFSEIMEKNSEWYYVLTNHAFEGCHVAKYTKKSDTLGEWNVESKDGVNPMHCNINLPTESGKPLYIKVQEAGASYSLSITGYIDGKRFCWIQCDDDGIFVDFYHCLAADIASAKDDNVASPQAFNEFFKQTGLKLGPYTNLTTHFSVEKCGF